MTKMKVTPKNYAEAAHALSPKHIKKIGNNTYLQRFVDVNGVGVAVRLHRTMIVKFYQDGHTTLHTDGYHTMVTKKRINQFIKGTVYQKGFAWYYVANRGELGYDWDNPIKFIEGMEAA